MSRNFRSAIVAHYATHEIIAHYLHEDNVRANNKVK